MIQCMPYCAHTEVCRGGFALSVLTRCLLSLRNSVTREAEFTSVQDVGIFVGTWNVNGKKPDFLDPVSGTR